ncbi:10358_t:CDS:2, partial [Ambispora gerdemannii]
KEQKIKCYVEKENARISTKAHDTDAGFDLYYPEKESLILPFEETTVIDLEIAVEVPENKKLLSKEEL